MARADGAIANDEVSGSRAAGNNGPRRNRDQANVFVVLNLERKSRGTWGASDLEGIASDGSVRCHGGFIDRPGKRLRIKSWSQLTSSGRPSRRFPRARALALALASGSNEPRRREARRGGAAVLRGPLGGAARREPATRGQQRAGPPEDISKSKSRSAAGRTRKQRQQEKQRPWAPKRRRPAPPRRQASHQVPVTRPYNPCRRSRWRGRRSRPSTCVSRSSSRAAATFRGGISDESLLAALVVTDDANVVEIVPLG